LGDVMMLTRMMVSLRSAKILKRCYRLRKKPLKVSINENELPLALRVVVSLFVGDADDGEDEDGRARMRVTRSSYFAWVSRGF